MTFLWSEVLWFLPVLVTLPFVYGWLLRRRKRAITFANLGLIKQAVAGRTSLRRHLPPALFYLALVLMAVALARPAAVITLPSERATIVLAMDVSASMRAQDMEPTRIAAAQTAARTFVSEQPRSVRIGLVAFSSNAMIAQVPTLNRDDMLNAIDHLHPQRYTAVGSGIVVALQAIFPDVDAEFATSSFPRRMQGVPLNAQADPAKPVQAPVPPGSFPSAVIVLLSDGQTNAGMQPLDAARMAADRGVRVFTVGFGSPQGGYVDFGGGTMRVQLDEETLKNIADITHGHYFNAQNSTDLREIYKALSAQFVSETKRTELTALIAGPALLLLLLAGILSLIWSNRLT